MRRKKPPCHAGRAPRVCIGLDPLRRRRRRPATCKRVQRSRSVSTDAATTLLPLRHGGCLCLPPSHAAAAVVAAAAAAAVPFVPCAAFACCKPSNSHHLHVLLPPSSALSLCTLFARHLLFSDRRDALCSEAAGGRGRGGAILRERAGGRSSCNRRNCDLPLKRLRMGTR